MVGKPGPGVTILEDLLAIHLAKATGTQEALSGKLIVNTQAGENMLAELSHQMPSRVTSGEAAHRPGRE